MSMSKSNVYKNNIEVPRYNFYNEPIMCTPEDYDTAKDEFVHHISKDPGVISIYQIGNVGVYGISDLDFIVVLDEKVKSKEYYFSIRNFSKKTRYILWHEQYFVNEVSIKNLHQVTSLFNLSHLYGEKFEINELRGEELKYNTLILLNDICIVSLCYEYLSYLKSKKLDVRLLLARLNSLKYPIQMVKSLSGKSFPEFDEFIYNFGKFRSSWFDLDKIERNKMLIYYLYEANTISQKLVKQIQEYNYVENIFSFSSKDNYEGYFDGEGTLIKFSKYSQSANTNQELPAVDIIFGFHLKEYTKFPGIISNHIDSHLSISGIYQVNKDIYKNLQKERIHLLNNLAEFRDSIGISFGGIFTFGYRKISLSSRLSFVNVLKSVWRRIV